ncbi:MAG: triphosphoribosyl-dephospho-CoA synthase [Acidilobaceae archaeon]|nr:triphosphoribosyl-dephospho-CoA synthase [Acidilobaceae archaeon]MCX8165029.1 triphosphoribosyl-dephospho-CoA synthase [Acidilobaceae archaeon]MDW7974454.1 triphosphoribosyl-dephospho-CoA synthase [Sulfolobales archaeon]
MEPCSAVPALSFGLYYEPSLHPKPGAVTPLAPHRDKDFQDFLLSASLAELSLMESCKKASLSAGLKKYRELSIALGLTTNVSIGSALLHMPLSTALGDGLASPEQLARRAHHIVTKSGEEEAREYYMLLEAFKPSHLGRYEGPVPSVGSGYPSSFIEVLKVASWDMVHRELLTGYPLSLGVLRELRGEGPLKSKALRALLLLLSENGDTLIGSKYGFSAYKRAKEEAREALLLSERVGVEKAMSWLDDLWRPRGWNPGAALDVLSVSISFYNYERVLPFIS